MPLYSFEGKSPTVHPEAFVAPTATVVGDVVIEAGASVWYGAVVRADYSRVSVRERANVQDGAVLHGPPDFETVIGPGVTVAHNCVVHGAVLDEECLIANGTVVLDGSHIGARSLIGANSLVAPNTDIPAGTLALGSPAKVIRELTGQAAEIVELNPAAYAELAQRHRAGVEPVSDA